MDISYKPYMGCQIPRQCGATVAGLQFSYLSSLVRQLPTITIMIKPEACEHRSLEAPLQSVLLLTTHPHTCRSQRHGLHLAERELAAWRHRSRCAHPTPGPSHLARP
jgi:hypothetical protein